jgi:hypothetical protein
MIRPVDLLLISPHFLPSVVVDLGVYPHQVQSCTYASIFHTLPASSLHKVSSEVEALDHEKKGEILTEENHRLIRVVKAIFNLCYWK